MQTSIVEHLANRSTKDRYVVRTEPDPFFPTLAGRRCPMIAVTTIVNDAIGYEVQLEPTSVNRRNREMTLNEVV